MMRTLPARAGLHVLRAQSQALAWFSCGALLGAGAACSSDHDAADSGAAGGGRDAGRDSDAATPDGGGKTTPRGRDAGSGGSGVPAPGTWPLMGYDARNNYWNPTETTIDVDNAASLEVKWMFDIAGYPPGSPAIAEGKVFVLATGGLYAIDLEAGTEVWSRTDLKGTSSVAYEDGFVYVHVDGARLYKLDAADGTDVWGPVLSYEHPGADGTSSPILGGGKVMVGHSSPNEVIAPTPQAQQETRGGVFAADTETGDEAWHYFTVKLPENGAMVWSSVSVDLELGRVYASTGNNYTVSGAHSDSIHAIDLASGDALWATQVREGDQWVLSKMGSADTDFGANPILADFGDKKLVAGGDKGSAFWALDRESGDILWSRAELSTNHNPQSGGVLNNGAFDGELFYVVANQPAAGFGAGGSSVLHALDPARDGEDAWVKNYPKIAWGMPTGANGVLFVPIDDELHVLDAKSGDELTMFSTGGTIAAGGAAIAGGRVVVQSGLVYQLGSVKSNNKVICYGLK